MDGMKTPVHPSKKRFPTVTDNLIPRTPDWRLSPGTPSFGTPGTPGAPSIGTPGTPSTGTPSIGKPSIGTSSPSTFGAGAQAKSRLERSCLCPKSNCSCVSAATLTTPSCLSERKRRSGWASGGTGTEGEDVSPSCMYARKRGRKDAGVSHEEFNMLPPCSLIDSPCQKSMDGDESSAKKIRGGDHPQQPVTPVMDLLPSSKPLRRRSVLKSSLVGLTVARPRSAVDATPEVVDASAGLESGISSEKQRAGKESDVEAQEQDCDVANDRDCVFMSMDRNFEGRKGTSPDNVVDLMSSSDDDDHEAEEELNDEDTGVKVEDMSEIADSKDKGRNNGLAGREGGAGVSISNKLQESSLEKGGRGVKGGKVSLIENRLSPSTPKQRRMVISIASPSIGQGMITRRMNVWKVMNKKKNSNNLLNYYRLSKGGSSSALRGKCSDSTKASNSLQNHATSSACQPSTKATRNTSTPQQMLGEKLPAATFDQCRLGLHTQQGHQEQRKAGTEQSPLSKEDDSVIPESPVSASQGRLKLEESQHEGQITIGGENIKLSGMPMKSLLGGSRGGFSEVTPMAGAKAVDQQAVGKSGGEGSRQSALRVPASPCLRSNSGKTVPLTSVLRSDRAEKSDTVSGTPGRRRVTFDLRHQDDTGIYGINGVIIASPPPATAAAHSWDLDPTCEGFDYLWKETKSVEFVWQNDPVYKGMLCMGCEHQYTDDHRERYLLSLAAESA